MALHFASSEGYGDVVEILLNHNADINRFDIVTRFEIVTRFVPCYAYKKGMQNIILMLTQRGANIDLVKSVIVDEHVLVFKA